VTSITDNLSDKKFGKLKARSPFPNVDESVLKGAPGSFIINFVSSLLMTFYYWTS